MESLILTVIAGALISAGTQFAKRTGIPGEIVLLVVTLVAAGIYQSFVTFVDPEVQKNVVEFAVEGAAVANLIYSFIIKRLETK